MKIALIIVGVLLAIAIALAAFMGAFRRIEITEGERGPFKLVYREMTGNDMKQVGEITTALDQVLTDAGIARRKPLDVFYADGHAEIGFAVEGSTPEQLASIGSAARVRDLPAQRFMIADFPRRNPLSFVVGYLKVDPALTSYRKSHAYRKVEALALNTGDTIVYLQPIVRD